MLVSVACVVDGKNGESVIAYKQHIKKFACSAILARDTAHNVMAQRPILVLLCSEDSPFLASILIVGSIPAGSAVVVSLTTLQIAIALCTCKR